MTYRPTVFILSYERPVYLWATLDSLYRCTQLDVRFVLLDNASKDPGVQQVVQGFDRRGMFDEVVWGESNDPMRLERSIAERKEDLGERFFFVENDVVVPDGMCWATAYDDVARDDPRTGMVGSFCDPTDFPEISRIRGLYPDASDEDIVFLAKARSPEREFRIDPDMRVWPDPEQHPPGRLLRLTTKAVDEVGIWGDAELGRRMRAAGFATKVCTTFRHRHLSLLNAFDLDDVSYAERRRAFFSGLGRRPLVKN